MKKELTEKQKAIRICNCGTMTPSMKNSMIKSALRKLSMYWIPIRECKKKAFIDRRKICTGLIYHSPTKTMPERELDYVMLNYYKCSGCGKAVPEKTFKFKEKKIKSKMLGRLRTFEIKFKNNVDIDHKNPVVSIEGKFNWHDIIEKLLDEDIDNYQLLCKECHKKMTYGEQKKRKKN